MLTGPLTQVGQIVGAVRDDAILVSCTKGILNDSLETPNEILKRVLPPTLHSRLTYLSGPSFAAEVAKQNPTAVTIASESDAVAKRVQVWGQQGGTGWGGVGWGGGCALTAMSCPAPRSITRDLRPQRSRLPACPPAPVLPRVRPDPRWCRR